MVVFSRVPAHPETGELATSQVQEDAVKSPLRTPPPASPPLPGERLRAVGKRLCRPAVSVKRVLPVMTIATESEADALRTALALVLAQALVTARAA
jgi:hypothetical protein